MKVLKKSETPEGVAIQVEDWSETYSFHEFADTIAAYPVAKYSDSYSAFSPKAGVKFRASFSVKNAFEVFRELETGEISLESLVGCMDEPRLAKCLTGRTE